MKIASNIPNPSFPQAFSGNPVPFLFANAGKARILDPRSGSGMTDWRSAPFSSLGVQVARLHGGFSLNNEILSQGRAFQTASRKGVIR